MSSSVGIVETDGRGGGDAGAGERGGRAGKAGGGERVHAALCSFLSGSHSLSALIPDRWREGRVGAKRLSPQAGRAGGGCFVPVVCVGRGSSWWSGCLASSEPVPQELGGGLRVDVVGAGKWARGEPATCLDWLCLAPAHRGQMLLPFTVHWGAGRDSGGWD